MKTKGRQEAAGYIHLCSGSGGGWGGVRGVSSCVTEDDSRPSANRQRLVEVIPTQSECAGHRLSLEGGGDGTGGGATTPWKTKAADTQGHLVP